MFDLLEGVRIPKKEFKELAEYDLLGYSFLGSKFLYILKMNIPMFTHFDIYAAKNNIDYSFAEISMFQRD